MQLTSLGYLIFIVWGLVCYYLLPKKYQPGILFVMSVLFYCSYNISLIGYIIATIISTYVAANIIEGKEKHDKNKKRILQLALVFNFGMLACVKYTDLLIPIGISFYTFQTTGYLLDVYWKKEKAEKNLFRYALFASFFPQIIQGPISKYKQLSVELYREHTFQGEKIESGILLIIWGFFKKIVIADTMAVAVSSVYDTPDYYGVSIIVGVLCYCAQLYCDFSGGIDVIRGTARLFDIYMVDNFRQPFASKSISEFWRRWHITLGIWMKDYVFYPVSLSKWNTKFGAKCRKIFGNGIGRKLPVCLANIIVFLLVGIWHGSSMNFIAYGLYNGFIIAISSLLTPVYDRMYQMTHISKNSKVMSYFQVVRTFLLVNIGWYFDRAISLQHAFDLMKRTFINVPISMENGAFLGLHKYQYAYVLFGIVLLVIVGVMKEKNIDMYLWIKDRPIYIQYAIWLILIFAIPIMGYYSPNSNVVGGFMYANF